MAALRPFLTLTVLALISTGVSAADCPPPPCFVRPPTLVVGFAPGGTADILARTLAPRLSESLGQQVIVENRPGAGGNIAATQVAQAGSDGHVILFAPTTAVTLNDKIYAKLPFEPRDLVPATIYASAPQVLVVNPNVAANNVRELISLAKQRPGQLSYGSAGPGSASHLSGEQFKSATGTDVLHVPYKGSGPATADLRGGQIQLLFMDLGQALPLIQRREVKALGITSAKRSPAAPDIPTLQESGVPGFESGLAYGLFMPRGTPSEIVSRISSEVRRAIQRPDMREHFARMGVDAVGSTPQEAAQYIQAESTKYASLVRQMNLRVE